MSKQIKLKQFGNSSSFTISKYEVNSDTWVTVLDIERDEGKKTYLVKNQEQTFVVDDKSEEISKAEKVLGRDFQKTDNRVIRKRIYSFLKGTYWQSYFENNGEIYSMDSLSSGTKGTLYPVNKNTVPVAVFSRSNIKINGQFQLELSVADWATDEDISSILLYYVSEYIATHNLSEVGLLSANVGISYAFNNRKILTPEHQQILPLEKRPTKFEAFSWYYATIPILYLIFASKVFHDTLAPFLIGFGCIGVVYLFIFGIVIFTKNMKV